MSIAGKGGIKFRQVGFEETSASEPPLMTCRNSQDDVKMLENQSAQQRPEDPMGAYDFTWLWRELGVGDERR